MMNEILPGLLVLFVATVTLITTVGIAIYIAKAAWKFRRALFIVSACSLAWLFMASKIFPVN